MAQCHDQTLGWGLREFAGVTAGFFRMAWLMCSHLKKCPDLFLLNEIPFGPWISARERFDEGVWKESCAIHEQGLCLLGELGAAVLAGSRPRKLEGRRADSGGHSIPWRTNAD